MQLLRLVKLESQKTYKQYYLYVCHVQVDSMCVFLCVCVDDWLSSFLWLAWLMVEMQPIGRLKLI